MIENRRILDVLPGKLFCNGRDWELLLELGPAVSDATSSFSREVDIEKIQDNPFAMRIENPDISELSQSLDQIGLLSPIKLRPHPTDSQVFQLIFGHRRLLAAKQLGWKSVVATIMNASDEQMLVFALAENLERVNYSDYEQAVLMRRLHDEFGKNLDEIATLVGRSQSFVSLHLTMLSLFDGTTANESEIVKVLTRLTERQARIISRLPDPSRRLSFAKFVLSEKLGLSEMEKLVGAPADSYLQSKTKFNWRRKRFEDEEKITKIICNILDGLQNKDLRTILALATPSRVSHVR